MPESSAEHGGVEDVAGLVAGEADVGVGAGARGGEGAAAHLGRSLAVRGPRAGAVDRLTEAPEVVAHAQQDRALFGGDRAVRHRRDVEDHVAVLAHKARSGPQTNKKGPAFDPQQVKALIIKGLNQSEEGDVNGAKESFAQAAQLNPSSYEAVQNLGAMLEASGDLNGAMAKYQEAMTLMPEFPGAIYNFAYCLEKAHLNSDAGAMYQKFHELTGRYPYDPRHIVALQQEEARDRARGAQQRKKGY